MKLNLAKELAALERMTVGQLHERYAEVFGETTRSRVWLAPDAATHTTAT